MSAYHAILRSARALTVSDFCDEAVPLDAGEDLDVLEDVPVQVQRLHGCACPHKQMSTAAGATERAGLHERMHRHLTLKSLFLVRRKKWQRSRKTKKSILSSRQQKPPESPHWLLLCRQNDKKAV